MAGLSNSSSSNVIFVGLSQGKFTVRAEEKAAGAVSRVNKDDKLVWEYRYDTLEGKLIDIVLDTESKYGTQWKFYFLSEGNVYCVGIPYASAMFPSIATRLPNVDVSKPFSMHVFLGTTDAAGKPLDNPRNILFIKQGGVKVNAYFTKDTPNGMPPLDKVKRQGKEVYDSAKRDTFLEDLLLDKIKPKLDGFSGADKQPALSNSDTEPSDDDLPF